MSFSGDVTCPESEEFVIKHRGMFDIKDVVRTAAARESRGKRLKTVRMSGVCRRDSMCQSSRSTSCT